jgi:hypothetical protein
MKNALVFIRVSLAVVLLTTTFACHRNLELTPVQSDPRYVGLPPDVVSFMKQVDTTDTRPYDNLVAPGEKISQAELIRRMKAVAEKNPNAGIRLQLQPTSGGQLSNPK